VGTVTNSYGFFSLSVPNGKNKLTVRYVGYIDYTLSVENAANQTINVSLVPASKELKNGRNYSQKR
jgi:hypothetical protein